MTNSDLRDKIQEIASKPQLTNDTEPKKDAKEILEEADEYHKNTVSDDVLSAQVIHAKKSFVEFLEGLLQSWLVKWWFGIFFYSLLICFVWFLYVSLCGIFYEKPPNKFYIEIWKSSIEFLKLLFAIVGAMFIFIRIFINGKV